MLTVQLCCNDDHGISTGRVIRVDFDEYELECEDTLWPPRGLKLSFREETQGTYMRVGRDDWRAIYGMGGGVNIFWSSVRMRGVDCIGLMNYLMTLKYWHANAGECYLFDHFNAKQPIVPHEFFKSREG